MLLFFVAFAFAFGGLMCALGHNNWQTITNAHVCIKWLLAFRTLVPLASPECSLANMLVVYYSQY